MTTRFPIDDGVQRRPSLAREESYTGNVPAGQYTTAAQHQVTSDLIDEAVEGVMRERGVDSNTAGVLRSLMASDPNTEFAKAFHQSQAAAGLARSHLAAVQKRVVIPYLLQDREMALLQSYAPEFRIEFKGTDLHDHALAAGSRKIDQLLVESKIPPGASCADLGGSPEHHAHSPTGNVHICQPVVDAKDPARSAQRRMRLTRLAASSQFESTRSFAAAYLRGEPAVVCNKTAQECTFKAMALMAVHVYDIKMADWPQIIENKGARLVEGCMLFSPRVLEQVQGQFENVGARFEVNPKQNKFRMGFANSPSWWYEHDWLEYCKYGIDQILYGKHGAYSYKVTERRGDTIFFRILPVSRGVPRNFHQVYRLPDVQMAEVHGFDISSRSSRYAARQKRTWLWPLPLWQDMMRHALEMVERGTLSHERLYNYYRTVAPRQTINAQLVAGGYTVSQQELLPLIVHVALAAAAAVCTSRSASQQIIGSELAKRGARDELTVYKCVAAFADGLSSAFGLILFPFTYVASAISNRARDMLRDNLVDWAPRAVCRSYSAKLLMTEVEGFDGNDFSAQEPDFTDLVQQEASFDHVTAAMNDADLAEVMLGMFSDSFSGQVRSDLQTVVSKGKEVKQQQMPAVQSVVSSSSVAGSTTLVSQSDGVGSAKFKADSILEAIQECEMEQKKVPSACAAAYQELCSGHPSLTSMRRRAEEFRNPDFWWVEAGVISRSALGIPPEDFSHAAVFSPVHNPQVDSLIRPVYTQEYSGSSSGSQVDRVHHVLADSSFTGWVFVNDTLQIYNGPEIVQTMRHALTKNLDFEVRLVQGPPGCGKTTSIVRSFQPECVVLCPVRKSTEETRGRLQEEKSCLGVNFKRVVRTLDSLLVNYFVNKDIKNLQPEILLADEGFMSHAGKWYAAAALLGVDLVKAFGDQFQIPHVPRAEAPRMHLRLKPDSTEEQWLTYRCPPDAVAAWGHIYDWKVRSTSSVGRSLAHVSSHRGLKIPHDCVMMGMYQADKKELRQMYQNCGTKVQIMTVHESQGKTFKHVWLHRFDRRKRTDTFSLYDKEAYVLVAMSRHTQEFKYICPDLGDLASSWIKQAQDIRRVQAASDVESAGLAKQFL
nr:MAG: replicase polyprotein (domains: methyltransferase, helicase) [Erysiphe necator associated ssRNA virus 9]